MVRVVPSFPAVAGVADLSEGPGEYLPEAGVGQGEGGEVRQGRQVPRPQAGQGPAREVEVLCAGGHAAQAQAGGGAGAAHGAVPARAGGGAGGGMAGPAQGGQQQEQHLPLVDHGVVIGTLAESLGHQDITHKFLLTVFLRHHRLH